MPEAPRPRRRYRLKRLLGRFVMKLSLAWLKLSLRLRKPPAFDHDDADLLNLSMDIAPRIPLDWGNPSGKAPDPDA